jgi:hypothetical protein
MNAKKTLILKILGAEILAVFFGYLAREEGRNYYFTAGLVPPAPLVLYDLIAPVMIAVLAGFCFGLAIFFYSYWGQVEQRQRQREIQERAQA